MSISERLKEERNRLGLTQAELSLAGGVKPRSQVHYEAGERKPDAVYLAAVAVVGVDVQYVLTGIRSDQVLNTDEREVLERYRISSRDLQNAARRMLG